MKAHDNIVIVTGGAGYIGSHTCKALYKAGYLPVCYDNLSTGHASSVKWGPLERGDILDGDRFRSVLANYEVSAIVHFAASAYVGESVANPGKYFRNNVMGSLTLLETARDHHIDAFIFSSSCATYGNPHRLPIREDTPQHPINPYGASKLMVERMLADFGSAHGLRSISLRYFNAAGADPDGEIGEDHDPETHLVPLALDAALGRRGPIAVYGTDYDTPDGTCVRDYIHVADLADAHVCALEALRRGAVQGAFNLGNGLGYSVLDVIEAIRRVTDLPVPVQYGDRRPGDPPILISDAARAMHELGWTPRFCSLDEIIRTAWAWHQYVSLRHERTLLTNAPPIPIAT